jgi:aspartyl protease family protein
MPALGPTALSTALLLGLFCSVGTAAHAAGSVLLTGSIGSRAILIVDGSAPKTVAVGESFQGVRLVSLQEGQAVVESDGKRLALRMDSPVSIGSSGNTGGGNGGSGSRIVLPADSRGHFVTLGAINGRSVNFLLDTGATAVSVSAADAQRIGLDYAHGRPIQMSTANGIGRGYLLQLDSVRVGDVEVHDVEAIVSEQPMPYVLLGNSFINRFTMRRDGDQMTLERRY